MDYTQHLDDLQRIAVEAGKIIMRFYETDVAVEEKADSSPVTEADVAANQYIVGELEKLTPEIPIIAEENAENAQLDLEKTPYFWLVDPLDGTKSFIRREGEFTVNIGLIEGDKPVMGVIYIPVQQTLYYGAVGKGAWRQEGKEAAQAIEARTPPEDGVDVVMSLSHNTPETDAFVSDLKVRHAIAASSSLKFCAIAQGRADVYPRFGPTMEWDTAAGHAILNAAGGRVELPHGAPLLYGKLHYRNPYFVGYGKSE